MVRTLELRATQSGTIWSQRPLISARGLLSCMQNMPSSSYDKQPARFRSVTFNSTGDICAATDAKGRVFAFFVTANRYALVSHLGVPTIACCFCPIRKTELLVTCEDETVRGPIGALQAHLFMRSCGYYRLDALTSSRRRSLAPYVGIGTRLAAPRSSDPASWRLQLRRTPSFCGTPTTGHVTEC